MSLQISDFHRILIRFGSSQLLTNFIRLLSGFLVVKLVEPEQYGTFTGIGVFAGYVVFAHFAMLSGLGREFPLELGKGRKNLAVAYAWSSWTVSFIISIIASLIFLSFSFWNFFIEDYFLGSIFLSYSIIGGLRLINKVFLPKLYRTNKDFKSLANQNLYVSLSLLLTVGLVYYFGVYGLMFRVALVAIVEFILLFRNLPINLKLRFSPKLSGKLVRTGIPIFFIGQVNIIWATLLNTFIFSVGGAYNFGLYAISNIVFGAMSVIPASISQVIYPRMSIMLGKGYSFQKILKNNIGTIAVSFCLLFLIAGLGAAILPGFINHFLPKYSEGIAAAQWMMFVPVAQSIGGINNLFNVIQKQKYYIFSLLVGAIMGSFLIYYSIESKGFYLEVFPQGLLLGKGVQQIMGLVLLLILAKNTQPGQL